MKVRSRVCIEPRATGRRTVPMQYQLRTLLVVLCLSAAVLGVDSQFNFDIAPAVIASLPAVFDSMLARVFAAMPCLAMVAAVLTFAEFGRKAPAALWVSCAALLLLMFLMMLHS